MRQNATLEERAYIPSRFYDRPAGARAAPLPAVKGILRRQAAASHHDQDELAAERIDDERRNAEPQEA